MVLHAGQRDTLIVIERATVVENDLGDEIETWAEFTRAYAMVRWGTAAERMERAQVKGAQMATFTILQTTATRAVTVRDRIVGAGGTWNIAGVSHIGRHEIALTVERSV